MLEKGYLQLFRWRGTAVRVHWTVPIGALLFTGMSFAPFAWLAFFGLIFLHELGHALVARRYGHRVAAIEVSGFGGLCRWSGYATEYERAAIAWGGVLAQAALFVITLGVVLFVGVPSGPLGQVVNVFLRTNAWLIALNLLPIPPLDGAEAWRILRWLPSRLRGDRFATRVESLGGRVVDAWRRLVRRVGRRSAPPAAPPARPTPAPKPSASKAPVADAELAELLRRIAADARQARRRT